EAGSRAATSSSSTSTADSAPALLDSTPARVEGPGKDDKAEQASPAVAEATVASHHPGVVLVLVLVVIASMLAGSLWWKLKNDQIKALVVPAPNKIADGNTPGSSRDPRESSPGISPPPAVTGGITSNGILSGAASGENTKTTTPDTSAANQHGAGKLPRVTGIRHWSSADSTTVVLDLQDQVQYEAHRLTGPDRIYFDLHDTGLAPELEGKTIDVGDGLLSRIRMAQPE